MLGYREFIKSFRQQANNKEENIAPTREAPILFTRKFICVVSASKALKNDTTSCQ